MLTFSFHNYDKLEFMEEKKLTLIKKLGQSESLYKLAVHFPLAGVVTDVIRRSESW